jgi:hypothetical protein
MTNEELEQKVKRLEEQLTELRIELLERKTDKKPYEVEVPEDIENYYIIGYTGYTDSVKHFPEATLKRNYIRGLVFKTKEQAEQFDKERILLFKMHKWAEEHNGDWFPDWENFHEIKYFIICRKEQREFDINRCRRFRPLTKLPYFKTEEIAEQFIEEFRDEIIEVFC